MNWTVDRHDLPRRPIRHLAGTSETARPPSRTHPRGNHRPWSRHAVGLLRRERPVGGSNAPELSETVDGSVLHETATMTRPRRASAGPASRSDGTLIAVHDLAARQLDLPLYRQWGLDPDAVPPTTYTVGIASPERMAEKAGKAADSGFGHLTVKLGTGDDRARLDAVRDAAPDADYVSTPTPPGLHRRLSTMRTGLPTLASRCWNSRSRPTISTASAA